MVLFFTIASIGLLLLLISALFGGEHGEHIDHDHYFHSLEAHTEHDVHHENAHLHTDEHAPSPFSVRVLSLFLVGFGTVGAIVHNNGWGAVGSSLIGTLAGTIAGWIGYKFINLLWRQQASSTVGANDLLGKTGKVTTAIPFSGIGEISIVVKGQQLHLMAREIGGDSVEEGSQIFVVETGEDVVAVHRT